MIKRTPLLVLAGVFALIVLAFFVLRRRGEAAGGQYDIETAAVSRGDVARIVSASGAVRALTTVEVGSQLSDQIGRAHV